MVDDDEDDYIIVQEMLSQARLCRYEMDWASTFEAGQAALQQPAYQAVLMDVELGIHSGLELVRRAVEENYPAVFIVYTGLSTPLLEAEAFEAGARLCLPKDGMDALLLDRALREALGG